MNLVKNKLLASQEVTVSLILENSEEPQFSCKMFWVMVYLIHKNMEEQQVYCE